MANPATLDTELEQLFRKSKVRFSQNFEIGEHLGRGQQGDIYRAQANGQSYILKRMLVRDADPPHIKENVLREVQIYRRLNHPAIPKLAHHEVERNPDFPEETHFLLMEDIQAESLDKRWQRQGPLSLGDLRSLKTQALEALAYAHSENVIHRDLKPENMLMSVNDRVTIIDWGTAKFEGQQARFDTLGVVGTPGYMAPEQLEGGETTAITDIYQLGSTLIAAARGEYHKPTDGPEELEEYLRGMSHLQELQAEIRAMIIRDPKQRAQHWKLHEGRYQLENAPKDAAYLSSSEVLQKLCTTDPNSPILYGIGKLTGAAALGAVTTGAGMATQYLINDRWLWGGDTGGLILGCLGVAFMGGAGLASGLFGGYFLLDGLSSLVKPLGIHSHDGTIYYRNGGYTNRASWSDKKFGTRITPIDNSDELRSPLENVLCNGIVIDETNMGSQVKTRTHYIYNAATKTSLPQTEVYTEYTAAIDGTWKGQPVRVYAVTESSDFASAITQRLKGTAVCVKGDVEREGVLEIDTIWDAYRGL